MATLAESLEGVTTGVEEAFYALQAGTADLVKDLARIDETVRGIASRDVPAGDVGSLADIEELRAAVAELNDGTSETAQLKEQLEVMARRLDAVAEPESAVEDVANRVEQLAGQLDELRSATQLDELNDGTSETAQLKEQLEVMARRLDAVAEPESASRTSRTGSSSWPGSSPS